MSSCSILASMPAGAHPQIVGVLRRASWLRHRWCADCWPCASLKPTSRCHSAFCCSSWRICWFTDGHLVGFAVEAFVAMAAHAAAQAENLAAGVERAGHLGDDFLGVALLAAGFDVLLVVQRPEPVFVVAVRLLDAGKRHAVAAVAGRAAELFGVVDLEQFLVRDGWRTPLRRPWRPRSASPARACPGGRIRSGPPGRRP